MNMVTNYASQAGGGDGVGGGAAGGRGCCWIPAFQGVKSLLSHP